MEKMTITRALRELKTLDARILKGINAMKFLDVTQDKYKNKALDSGKKVDDFEKEVKAQYESVNDLIERRAKMKAAIMVANATNSVEFNGEQWTIYDLIDMKNSLKYKQEMYRRLKDEIGMYNRKLVTYRENIDSQVEDLVQRNTGKDRKVDAEDYKKIAEPFIQANELKLLDPINAQEKMEALDKEIADVDTNIDVLLSEANAKIEITLQ